MRIIKAIQIDNLENDLEEALFKYSDILSDELGYFAHKFNELNKLRPTEDIEDESPEAEAWWDKRMKLIDKHQDMILKKILKVLMEESEK